MNKSRLSHFNKLIIYLQFIVDWGEERLRSSGAESTSLGVDLDLAIRPQLGYLTEDGESTFVTTTESNL